MRACDECKYSADRGCYIACVVTKHLVVDADGNPLPCAKDGKPLYPSEEVCVNYDNIK